MGPFAWRQDDGHRPLGRADFGSAAAGFFSGGESRAISSFRTICSGLCRCLRPLVIKVSLPNGHLNLHNIWVSFSTAGQNGLEGIGRRESGLTAALLPSKMVLISYREYDH